MDNRTLRKLKRIHRQLSRTKTNNYDSVEEIRSIVDIQIRLSHLILEVEQNKK
jgi:hypothetical protein